MRHIENPIPYWIGPDIVMNEDVVISDMSSVSVTIDPKSLPPMFRQHPDLQVMIAPSMRSRYAQLGLDFQGLVDGWGLVDGMLMNFIATALTESKSEDPSGNIFKPFSASITIFNNGLRPVKLEEGARLFRFFNRFKRPIARGKEVVHLIESGQVKLNGEFGKDWSWCYAYDQGIPSFITGIHVRIDEKNRMWIPPDVSDVPVNINDQGQDYRKSLDELLTEVPEREDLTFWVGETAPEISLQPTVDAIIDYKVLPDISEEIINYKQIGDHASSHLLEGGKTNWKVRVEVISSTVRTEMPNAVTLHFAPKSETTL